MTRLPYGSAASHGNWADIASMGIVQVVLEARIGYVSFGNRFSGG